MEGGGKGGKKWKREEGKRDGERRGKEGVSRERGGGKEVGGR